MSDVAQSQVSHGHDGETRRDFLTLTASALGVVGARLRDLAVYRQPQPGQGYARAVDDRCRSVAGPGRPAPDRRLAGQAGVHRPPPAGRDQGGAGCRHLEPARSATDAQRVQKPEWLIVVGVCTHLGCIPLGAESRATTAAPLAAGSARATARSTIPRRASGRARRRSTCWCRRTNSPPTPRSRSVRSTPCP
jgi:ubiquinol-cytochrome c reductase iron-sulfur subunit